MDVRICTKCGSEFPATTEYFGKQKNGKYGLKSWCKTCDKEYHLQWQRNNPSKRRQYQKKQRAKNPEQYRAYARNDYVRHKEKRKAADKRYYLNNREQKLEYRKQYYEKHKEAYAAYNKQYQLENKEEISAKSTEWRKNNYTRYRESIREWLRNNPDKKQIYWCRRETQKKNLAVKFTAKDWIMCKEVFNHCCAYCGKKSERLTQDHFIPLAADGSYTIDNIVPACRKCNSSKNDSNFFEWYPKQKIYSVKRFNAIIKYLGYSRDGKYKQGNLFGADCRPLGDKKSGR